MSIQRLAREVKKIALGDNLSDAVVREALGHLKAVGSAGGAIDAAVEQLVHRARVAKKFADLARNPQHTKPIYTRLLQMGFGAHELNGIVPPSSAKMKTAAPAKPRAAVPMRAKPSAPAKNTARGTARVSAPSGAQSTNAQIQQRKRAINARLREEERGGK